MKTDMVISDVKGVIERFRKNFVGNMIGCDCGILILKKIGEEDYYHSVPIILDSSNRISIGKHKRLNYLRTICRERVMSLFKSAVEFGHISSVQDVSKPDLSPVGAIVAGGWVYGFAGLEYYMNELLMVEVATKQGAITAFEAAQILNLYKNRFVI